MLLAQTFQQESINEIEVSAKNIECLGFRKKGEDAEFL